MKETVAEWYERESVDRTVSGEDAAYMDALELGKQKAEQLERELAAAIAERDEWAQAAHEVTDVDPATPEFLRIWAQARIDDYTTASAHAEAAITLRDKYAIERDAARAALREAIDEAEAGDCAGFGADDKEKFARWRKAAGLEPT